MMSCSSFLTPSLKIFVYLYMLLYNKLKAKGVLCRVRYHCAKYSKPLETGLFSADGSIHLPPDAKMLYNRNSFE